MTTPVQTPTSRQLAESAARRAIWLSIAALAMTFMLPLAGLVMALFALAAGFRALPLLRAEERPTGVTIGSMVVSSFALLLSAAATALQLYLMDEYNAYTECMKGAGTVSSQGECFDQFRESTSKKLPADVVRILGSVQP
ncbi:hypothetical protein [Nonomuraea sp. NPDC046570]|uniref:hypothetical protein n=1 Tax=Nonomuraea sp. NPDC046570 TaxID=3155255 RepID=UPI0033C39ACD